MEKISLDKRRRIVNLRKVGKSIPEIVSETGYAKTTVTRYVRDIHISAKRLQGLKEKQGGAKARARELRENILTHAKTLLGKSLSERDLLLLLVGLYWGEGTKKDFSLINSDASLIQTFIHCLLSMGIRRERFSMAIRVHDNISIRKAKAYWVKMTGLPTKYITTIEVIDGKKKGKLPHGICRVRVRSGIRERLLIQSAISLIGKDSNKRLLST